MFEQAQRDTHEKRDTRDTSCVSCRDMKQQNVIWALVRRTLSAAFRGKNLSSVDTKSTL